MLKKIWQAWGHYQDLIALGGAVSALVGWAVTFFGAAWEGWSVTGVWLASLAAGALVAFIWLCIAAVLAMRKMAVSASPPEASSPLNSTPFSIEFGEGGSFESIPKHNLYAITRQLNVCLRNTDPVKALHKCKVQIMSISPESGLRLPRTLKDNFSLAAGDEIYIPLASYGEARDIDKFDCSNTLIEIFGPDGTHSLSRDHSSTVTLRATSFDAPFIESTCEIWVDANGRFRIRHQDDESKPISLRVESTKPNADHDRDLVPTNFQIRGIETKDGFDLQAVFYYRNRSLTDLQVRIDGWFLKVDGRLPSSPKIGIGAVIKKETTEHVTLPLIRIARASSGVKGEAALSLKFGFVEDELLTVLRMRHEFIIKGYKTRGHLQVPVDIDDTAVHSYIDLTKA